MASLPIHFVVGVSSFEAAFAIWIPEGNRIAEANVAHNPLASSRMNFISREVLARPEKCLSQNDLLGSLSDMEAALLIPYLKIVQYKLGDILFHAEETADYVFFPLDGTVI
jgi:hypothetical protein